MSANPNPVGWFEIYVQDMDRAKAFYEKTFQTTLEHIDMPGLEMWAFPMKSEAPGCAGSLVKMEGKSSGGGGTIIYFVCGDCTEEGARAAENGGKIEAPKFPIPPHGFISFILDTEGNRIGLHSMK